MAGNEKVAAPAKPASKEPPRSAQATASDSSPDRLQATVLGLQRSIGNRAFGDLVKAGRSSRDRSALGVEAVVANALGEATATMPIGRPAASSGLPVRKADSVPEIDGASRREKVERSIQREETPTTAREKIETALRTKDVSDVKAIKDYGAASEAEKFALIDILLNQGWVGPFDEWALEAIWHTFGEGVVAVADRHLATWDACVDRGAELTDLPQVKRLKERFPADIRGVVTGYLFRNRAFVVAELARLGLSPTGEVDAGPPSAQQSDEIQEMQAAASLIAKLQKAQETVRGNVLVGYEPAPSSPPNIADPSQGGSSTFNLPSFTPVYFDPFNPPRLDHDPTPNLLGTSPAKLTPYDEVKAQYDAASDAITNWLTAYPALYAIGRQGKSADTANFAKEADPQAARKQLGAAMSSLIADIEQTQVKLNEGDLDPLDLTPVQAQLLRGQNGPTGIDWSSPLAKSVAEQLLAGHEFNKALVTLGFETAAQALFMVAPLTGGAAFFVVLAGVGVVGAKAYRSANDFATLDQAAKTTATPGTQLVATGQVEHAKQVAEADRIALSLAVLAIGATAAAGALGAIRGPGMAALDQTATRAIVASDLTVARSLSQRALTGPIPEAELLKMQEVGLLTRTAQRWANYRGFEVLYRGQKVPTGSIVSPVGRGEGAAASVELYEQMRQQGLSDQEIANYTAKFNDQPVPAFSAPPGMAGQPLGGVGIPTTRLPNIASDFAQSPTGVIYVLRIPKSLPVQVGTGGWGMQSALEQEYVVFHQIPNGYVVRTISPEGVGPLQFDSPPGVGPSLVRPPAAQ